MQIIVKLTTSCNFSCSYCSEGNQSEESLPPEVFHKLVDELPELLEKRPGEGVEFLWHGGEPLLYGKEKLTGLMDYAKEHLSSYSPRFLMQTNGYLIDDAWIDIFRRYDIAPGISLDGYPELHDKNRQTKDGKPTADVVLKNLLRLREAGVGAGTLMVVNTAAPIDSRRLFAFICKYSLHPKIHAVIPCGYAGTRTDTDAVYQN